MAIQQNFPAIKPTLLLDFANTEQLDPRITFTRASTATYYGTETAKAEENLFEQSQTWATSPWTSINVTVTNNTVDTTAPDGTSTAVKIDLNASTGVAKFVRQAQPSLSNVVVSMFLKAGTHGIVQIYAEGSTGNFCNFDLTGGTVGTAGANATGFIVALANDWYRCIVVFGSAAGNRSYIAAIDSTAAGFAANTTAASVNFFGWGAQREQRSAATAYTPTTTQPITNYIPVLESAASGVARFDHNPITFESLGLLIWESRTNLILRSEEFDDAGWTKTNATITANTIVAPSGELTGDKLIVSDGIASNSSTIRSPDFSKAASPVTFAFSIYAKAGEYNTLRLFPRDSANAGNSADVRFNLVNGTVISAVAAGTYTAVSGVITSVGNDWYRCTALFTTGSETTFRPQVLQLNNNANVTGDGFSGIFIWGAQLEAGAFPTSYIPTVASQVTRAADAASMTGANFSSWYNQAEGSFVSAYSRFLPVVGNQVAFMVSDGTINNNIFINSNSDRALITTNNTNQINIGAISPGANQLIIRSLGYKIDDCATSANGAAVVTDTSALIPVVNQLSIGFSPVFSASRINGHIRKLSYYPLRLSNTNLQALTS